MSAGATKWPRSAARLLYFIVSTFNTLASGLSYMNYADLSDPGQAGTSNLEFQLQREQLRDTHFV